MAVCTNDLLQDVVHTLGPDEWLGIGVVMGDVIVIGSDHFRHAGEHPSALPLGRDVAKEPLDHV